MSPKELKKEAKREKSLNAPIISALFAIAAPIFLTNLLQGMYQFIDAYWIGKLGTDAVASIAVSFPILFLMISVGMGFSFAGSTLVAQYHGANNERKVHYTAAQSMVTMGVIGLILGIIGYFSTPFFLNLLGVEHAVALHAGPYLQISYIGLISMFLFMMFQSILRGVSEVKLPMYIIGGAVLINAVLDPIFIHGWGPIPAQGVAGAAIVTIFSQTIAAVIGIAILLSKKYDVEIHIPDLKPDWKYIKKALVMGIPSSFEMSARALGFILITFLVTGFGTTQLAGFGAAGNIFNFILIPTLGLSMAVAALVGQNIGAKQFDRATEVIKVSSLITFIGLTVIGIIIFFFADNCIQIFIKDPEVVAAGAIVLKINALVYGFLGVQIALTGVLRAAGMMTVAMMTAILSVWGIQFPLAYILSQHTSLGVTGIWWSFATANVVMALVTGYIVWTGSWKKKQII